MFNLANNKSFAQEKKPKKESDFAFFDDFLGTDKTKQLKEIQNK